METLIYVEPSEQKVDPVVKQIAARLKQGQVHGPIKGIVIGNHFKGKETELSGFLDELLVVDAPQGEEYNMESVASILASFLGELPSVLFLGLSHQGMELGPAVASRLGLPLVTAVTDFDLSEGKASVKRLVHGGKVSLTLEVETQQGAIFSVQKGALKGVDVESQVSTAALPVREISWKEGWAATKTRVTEIIREAVGEGQDITKARILVSVGRGLGNQDNLPMARELAEFLDAMVSCSRPVVDMGWLPGLHQVGLSGKTVSPVVYLALAISGQANHVVGMETSKIIIAVNKDSAAPIFQLAHYGVIDDIQQFVPQMIDQLKRERG